MESPPACPTCAAPVQHGQEYCLECGARITPAPRAVLHWAWPSLAGLLVAAGGAAVAIAAGADSPPETVVALSPLRPASSTPAGAGKQRLTAWRRTDGYTIVVGAIPVDRGERAARSRAREALRSGLRDIGVLRSSGYASLHPGYFLVFSGAYDTPEEAEAALPRARGRFRSAHVRRIAR